MDNFLKKLNDNLRPVIQEKFQGVISRSEEELTQEHETMTTGLKLFAELLQDEAIADSSEFISLMVKEIEMALSNSEVILQEFISLKLIDRTGTGRYYNVCIVGKYQKSHQTGEG